MADEYFHLWPSTGPLTGDEKVPLDNGAAARTTTVGEIADLHNAATGTGGVHALPLIRSIGVSTTIAAALEALSDALPKNLRRLSPKYSEQGVIELGAGAWQLERLIKIDLSGAVSRQALKIRGQGMGSTVLTTSATASAADFKDADGAYKMLSVVADGAGKNDYFELSDVEFVPNFTQGGDGVTRLQDPMRAIELVYANHCSVRSVRVFAYTLGRNGTDQFGLYVKRCYYGAVGRYKFTTFPIVGGGVGMNGSAATAWSGVALGLEENNALHVSDLSALGCNLGVLFTTEHGARVEGFNLENHNRGFHFENGSANNIAERGYTEWRRFDSSGELQVAELDSIATFGATSHHNYVQTANSRAPRFVGHVDRSPSKSNTVVVGPDQQASDAYSASSLPLGACATSGLTTEDSAAAPRSFPSQGSLAVSWPGGYDQAVYWPVTIDPRVGTVRVLLSVRRMSGDGMMCPRLTSVGVTGNNNIAAGTLLDPLRRHENASGAIGALDLAAFGHSYASGNGGEVTLRTARSDHLMQPGMRLLSSGIGTITDGTALYVRSTPTRDTLVLGVPTPSTLADPGTITGGSLSLPSDMHEWVGQPDASRDWLDIDRQVCPNHNVVALELTGVTSYAKITLDTSAALAGITDGSKLMLWGFNDSRLDGAAYVATAADISGSSITLTSLGAMVGLDVSSAADNGLDSSLTVFGKIGFTEVLVTLVGKTNGNAACAWRVTEPIVQPGYRRGGAPVDESDCRGMVQDLANAQTMNGSESVPVGVGRRTVRATSGAVAAYVRSLASAASSSPTQYPELRYEAPALSAHSDWIADEEAYIVSNPTAGDFRGYLPLDGFVVDQTTPTFVICYPRRPGSPATNITFTWEVREKGGSTSAAQTGSAGQHYMRWGAELRRGVTHEWRCRRNDSSTWSGWREFTVRVDAATWIFRTQSQVLADVKAKARPRTMPPDFYDRVELYKVGGSLRGCTTAMISRFAEWSAIAVPEPTNVDGHLYTVNNLQLEYLIHVNGWWLEQVDGGGTYKAECLRRIRQMLYGASSPSEETFTPAGVPNSMSTHPQEIRTLVCLLAIAFDLWYSDLTAGDKVELLQLADAKLDLLYDNIATGVSTLDGIMGFTGYWRSVTFTNRLMLCFASACFAGDAGLSAQMIANTDAAAQRLEYLAAWDPNYGMGDGGHGEQQYYADAGGFMFPSVTDATSGLLGIDLSRARPFPRDHVSSMASMYPFTSASRMYPFSDATDGSTGAVVVNTGLAFADPPSEVAVWLGRAYATRALHETAQSAQASSFLNRRNRPPLPTVRRLGVAHPDAGIVGSTDGRSLGVELFHRCSPLGSQIHMHADHNELQIGHGGVMLEGFPGAYKWAPSLSYPARHASCKSIAHNTIGMDLALHSGAYYQCLGQQKWSNALTGTNAHLIKTRGKYRSIVDTAAYMAWVGDATDAYWMSGYELSLSLRAVVHVRPGLVIVVDACDSSSGAHTWHAQFKTRVLPTFAAPWVTVSDSPGVLKRQNPYASGTISRTLGNQGWWDNETPPSSPPAAPYNNSIDLPSATTMRLVTVYQVGSDAVTVVSSGASGDEITTVVTYLGRTWIVAFNAGSGALRIT